MINKEGNIKEKINLKQLVTVIISIILLILIVYILPINESNKDLPPENITIDSSNIEIDNVPPYSGKLVITINNNEPYFENDDISTKNFEDYSKLDDFDRAGVAFANICKYTMPPEGTKRGNISYKPTGWVQYLYGESNTKHLYERCHLIAWQLGNENNNKENLITGTEQLNDAMIVYENIVANWIKQKNEQNKDYHVLYRVTPIYEEKNKLATGVQMEAKSVEEVGVCFNKFIYNVQDNFEIDYSTGEAKLIK